MRHELARQVGSNHLHVELFEMEVYTNGLHSRFQPAIGTKIPFTRSHQNAPSDILETENDNCNNPCHPKNAEQHPAEHFKVSAKRKEIAAVCNFFILKLCQLFLLCFSLLQGMLLRILPFRFLLRHCSLRLLREAHSSLS